MFKQNISLDVWGGQAGKYRLKDELGENIDKVPEDTCNRVARSLSSLEDNSVSEHYFGEFSRIMLEGKFAGGGRIMANIGAEAYKKEVSPINCTVIRQIPDSMAGIMDTAKDAALALKAGCGVGYDFSTIRPKGAYVNGAGAETSGVISFMKIFDSMCATVMSGGGRRGAQMGCLDIQHPEVESFISCKRQDGMLRYFNLSLLVTNAFMNAVVDGDDWDLWFWKKTALSHGEHEVFIVKKDNTPFSNPEHSFYSFDKMHTEVLSGNCSEFDVFKKEVFKTIEARELFSLIMKSTYDFAEPGFILIDKVNEENNLWFCESIRATNPCGEQPLAPNASCLLGSMILHPYVSDPFDRKRASFDFGALEADVRTASRLLDNVVEVNNLPVDDMRDQIFEKRRHGLGFTGLGTALNMLCMRYGSEDSIEFSEKIMLTIAQATLLEGINIAKEKGCAPILGSKENRESLLCSGYMIRLLSSFGSDEAHVRGEVLKHGIRWSHGTSIAPTGTLSLTWGNNCSNGIEPSFSDSYVRNIRVYGKKTKVQEEVTSFEYDLFRSINGDSDMPEWWSVTGDLAVDDHINIQSAVQKWCDSAVSKTANVPTDYPFDKFEKIYMTGWKSGLKGITTFRFNPEVFSGVIVRKDDLESTEYVFSLEDGTEIRAKGTDTVLYDGEEHNAANLFDALKENIYGDM
jgi:ribonucleoside-diphosphate reductase alpha chain